MNLNLISLSSFSGFQFATTTKIKFDCESGHAPPAIPSKDGKTLYPAFEFAKTATKGVPAATKKEIVTFLGNKSYYGLVETMTEEFETDTCCFCLEDMKVGEQIITTHCQHTFHFSCFKDNYDKMRALTEQDLDGDYDELVGTEYGGVANGGMEPAFDEWGNKIMVNLPFVPARTDFLGRRTPGYQPAPYQKYVPRVICPMCRKRVNDKFHKTTKGVCVKI